MLRFLYGDELTDFPDLADSMFRDRADQFANRLGWDVTVTDDRERDQYDALGPLYVIWQTPTGRHGGSMRLMPTTGPCMVNDHFTHLTDGTEIRSPLIWESTRFCLSRDASRGVAGALMLAGGEVMRQFGLNHLAGVFDARMVRIYRAIGSSPTIVGSQGKGRDMISVGLWEYDEAARLRIASRAGISTDQVEAWFDAAFGGREVKAMAAA